MKRLQLVYFINILVLVFLIHNTTIAQTSENTALTWLKKAENTKNRDSIIIYASNAIRLQPSLIDAYLRRGTIYRLQRKFDKAEKDFNKILSLNHKHAPTYYQKGYIQYSKANYYKAKLHAEKAISIDANNDNYYTLKGEAAYKLKEYQIAIAAFTKAIQIKNHPYDYLQRGLAYHFNNQIKLAEADYKKANQLSPNKYSLAYNNLGSIYQERGEYLEAKLSYGKAKSLKPNDKFYQDNYNKMDKFLYKLKHHKYDPEPLGFQIGTTPYQKVKAGVASYNFKYSGKNKWNNGPMYESKQNTFGIDGLKNVTFIFDDDKMLDALMMKMNKNKFDAVYNYLNSKYILISKTIPYVGDKYVKFKKGNSVIIIEAMHMSFEMIVVYKTVEFDQQHIAGTKREKNQKERTQLDKF